MPSRFVAMVCLGLTTMLVGCADPNEPKFEGRGLSSWRSDFRSSDVATKEKAVQAFGKIGTPAMADLTKAIKDEEPTVRFFAIQSINGILDVPETTAETKAVVLEQLTIAVKDPTTGNRTEALEGLAKIGEPALPVVEAAAKDSAGLFEMQVIRTLESMGRTYPDKVKPILMSIYQTDEDLGSREKAREALYALGEDLPKVRSKKNNKGEEVPDDSPVTEEPETKDDVANDTSKEKSKE